ncbi:MAG: DUF2251 domain-containing protein [Bryobacteraceae bacterium]|nr:DUF2251 domain-containing protein [Bryobacteraceae bacterium]
MNAFVTEEAGPSGVFGVFEDDGEAGYLYLYEPGDREVFNHLHIYDRNTNLQVREQDVRVIWSEDHSKVGVVIWGKLRGVINLVTGQEGRVWLEDVNTPGIGDAQWLKGFRM